MAVITISRQYGCGGGKFARKLAEKLGYAYFDKEIFQKVAEMSNISVEDLKALEGLIGYKIDIISKLVSNDFIKKIVGISKRVPEPDELVKYIEETIVDFAKLNKSIIVGRGSQCILKDFPNAYHIKIVATLEDRIENLMKRGTTREGALSTIKRMDEIRKNYIQRYYNQDWSDPSLYHLVINFSKVSEDKAIEIIKELIDYKIEK